MLRTFQDIRGLAIRATDGRIGTVGDLYFDDNTWRLRHCVVDTGRWFAARYVLVAPRALSVLDPGQRELWVRLSRSEIRSSRVAASDEPVSKQHRRRLTAYHPATELHDPHLRSCAAVLGHTFEATDGSVGRVDDFVIDDKGWAISGLVVDARHASLSDGSRVVIRPQHVDRISWPKAMISAGLSRAELMAATPAVKADLFH